MTDGHLGAARIYTSLTGTILDDAAEMFVRLTTYVVKNPGQVMESGRNR